MFRVTSPVSGKPSGDVNCLDEMANRAHTASSVLQGSGIEIGALHSPRDSKIRTPYTARLSSIAES